MYNITEINKIMHIDSLDNFKRFCVMNGVCGIDHADASVSGLKYPFWSHAIECITRDGRVLHVLNTQVVEVLLKKKLNGLKYEILGTGESFCLPGVSHLVVIDVTELKGKQ